MKKGFTLVELLAVVIILGIVALIATPAITNVIKESKMATYKMSVENLVDSLNTEMVSAKNYTDTYYIYHNNKIKIVRQGQQPDENMMVMDTNVDAEGKVYVDFLKRKFAYFYNDKYCVYSNKDIEEMQVVSFESEQDCMERAQFYSWLDDENELSSVQVSTLEEMRDILIRIQELGSRALNGTFDDDELKNTLTLETYALQDEIQRLYEETMYNNVKALQPSAKSIEIDLSTKELGLKNDNLKDTQDWVNYMEQTQNVQNNILHKTFNTIGCNQNSNWLRELYYVQGDQGVFENALYPNMYQMLMTSLNGTETETDIWNLLYQFNTEYDLLNEFASYSDNSEISTEHLGLRRINLDDIKTEDIEHNLNILSTLLNN